MGVVLGSDKTTVSVATGHVEYHPLYLSIGNIHNSVRRAHRNSVTPIAFLAIPKCEHFFIISFPVMTPFQPNESMTMIRNSELSNVSCITHPYPLSCKVSSQE